MTISYVSSAFAEATSISSMPSHQAGDLLIIGAYRGASGLAPTVPSGWKTIFSQVGSANALITAFKIATTGSETSGTWTNAEMLMCGVWRDSVNYLYPVDSNGSSGNSTTMSYPSLSTQSFFSDSTHWVAGFGGGALNSTTTESAPSGMTNRGSLAGASTNEIALHDTNANVSSWSSANVTVSSEKWATIVVEIRDTGIALSSGGAPHNAIRSQGQEGVLAA